MGGSPQRNGYGPHRGMNVATHQPFERNNGWGGPLNGGNLMNQSPPNIMQPGGGMNSGLHQNQMNQGNGGPPGKTSTQVTIPKDVSSP